MDCSTFLLQVRYYAADAKEALQQYIEQNPLITKTPMTKEQVMNVFYTTLLCNYSKRGVKSLCEFLYAKALANNYLVKVPKIWHDDIDEFIVNPDILDMKPGPKRKSK